MIFVMWRQNQLFSKTLYFNLFSTNFPLLYPLKASENLQFSDVFKGYRSGALIENGFPVTLWSKL